MSLYFVTISVFDWMNNINIRFFWKLIFSEGLKNVRDFQESKEKSLKIRKKNEYRVSWNIPKLFSRIFITKFWRRHNFHHVSVSPPRVYFYMFPNNWYTINFVSLFYKNACLIKKTFSSRSRTKHFKL